MNLVRQSVIFVLLLLPPVVLSAANDCFCLQDDAANIRYGCSTQKKGYRDETRCLDEAGGEFVVSDWQEDWTEIEKDTGRCDPCRQTLSIGKQIRGEDEDDEDAGETPEVAGDEHTE